MPLIRNFYFHHQRENSAEAVLDPPSTLEKSRTDSQVENCVPSCLVCFRLIFRALLSHWCNNSRALLVGAGLILEIRGIKFRNLRTSRRLSQKPSGWRQDPDAFRARKKAATGPALINEWAWCRAVLHQIHRRICVCESLKRDDTLRVSNLGIATRGNRFGGLKSRFLCIYFSWHFPGLK